MAEKRKLFEDVGGAATARAKAITGGIDRNRNSARGAIRVWFLR
jgi:cytochrome c oxidase assembly protein subunit 15